MAISAFDPLNMNHMSVLVTANSGSVYNRIKKNITKVVLEICKEEGKQSVLEMRHFRPGYSGVQTSQSDTIEIHGLGVSNNPPWDMLNFDDIDFTKPVIAPKDTRTGKYDRMKAAVTELDDAAKECGLYDDELHSVLLLLRSALNLLEDDT